MLSEKSTKVQKKISVTGHTHRYYTLKKLLVVLPRLKKNVLFVLFKITY
jgi:hypothetical protein